VSVITHRYWVAEEKDGTFTVHRKSSGDPSWDSGYLSGQFGSREAAEAEMQRTKEFDASDFGKEFNEALDKEDWS
jgi:hypothetical protein